MTTQNLQKDVPVGVPPEQNNPHIIQPATTSKYEMPLSKTGARALEKYYKEYMPDTKDMNSRQIERMKMKLRKRFMKMRYKRVENEAAAQAVKKQSKEAYLKKKAEMIAEEKEKNKKVEERLKMLLSRNRGYKSVNQEQKKTSLPSESRYPERNEHFTSQPVYPEPMPFQQNNLYSQNNYQQYQQGYQQSFEPVRNEYQQSGMLHEQPNNWVDRTWRGQDEYRTYPSSSFSAYSQSAGPSQAQTASNFYGQPTQNFDTSYTPFMPDLISQAASTAVNNQPILSSYQQPERFVSPPTPIRNATLEVEKMAMQQQRLLEIEKELQIIEHQKMESAMEEELRRRTDELKDREHWIAVRERQLYEMERNNERRWNEESYYEEPSSRSPPPPSSSSSQSRRQRARNRTTTRHETTSPPDVVPKKKHRNVVDIATRDRLRDERDANAARRHGQRGSVMKHFGPSTSSVSTTSANSKKSSKSAAKSKRFGRIQDDVKLK